MTFRVVAAAMLVMVAMPAQAQMGGGKRMAATTRRSRKSRKWTTRPTRPRWSEYPTPRKNMIRGASPAPPTPRRNRNSLSIAVFRMMPAMRYLSGLLVVMSLIAAPAFGWEYWGGDRGGTRFSPLNQITPQNVDNLVRAWEFRTGDLDARAPAVMARTKFEATPLLVEDSLVFCSPFNEVIALDPGTGAQKWRYDPKISTAQRPANRYNCRGVAYWVDDQAAEGRGLPRPHFHGHQRCPRDRARRQDRDSLRRFRQPMARSSSRSASRWCGRANSRSPRRRW